MTAKYILGSIVGTLGIAYCCDYLISDKKIFGGSTPKTVSNKELLRETNRRLDAWPRSAGPPVIMNPISRQYWIVKDNLYE